jgi:hypothetical protein
LAKSALSPRQRSFFAPKPQGLGNADEKNDPMLVPCEVPIMSFLNARMISMIGAIMLTLLALSSPCLGAENLLQNPTFAGAEGRIPPSGWSLYGKMTGGNSVTVVAEDDPAQRGLLITDGVSLPRGADGEIGLSQTVSAEPGLGYQVTAQIKAVPNASTHGAYMQLRFLPSGKLFQTGLNTEDTEDFAEVSVSGMAPADTTRITIYIYTHAAPTPQVIVRSVELITGADIDAMPDPEPPVYATLKKLHRETDLVRDGHPQARIVVPESGIYDAQALSIQRAIAGRTGVEVPIVTEDDPWAAVHVPGHWAGPEALKPKQPIAEETPPLASNLIVLGNRSTNKTISALYDLYFTLLDLKYPGTSGHEVRTLHSPFGDGKNVIFVGGSDTEGVAQATAVLVGAIEEAAATPGLLTLGWLMDIQLGSGMQVPTRLDQVQTWEASVGYGSSGYFGWNSISKRMALYYMTGDPVHAREFLRLAFPDDQTKKWIADNDGEMIENKDDPLAGPYHYNAHMMILFWDLIEESPVFTDAERLQVTNAFSRQLKHRRDEGIYGRSVPTAVGSRHGQWSAISMYALGRYFQKEYGDRVWDYAVYGALNHFGSLHRYGSVSGESDNLYWLNTGIAPIFTYLVMSGDRRPVDNGVVDELLRAQEMLISGCIPDWALQYASLGYLHKAAYITGDGRWLRYRERTVLDTDTFRLGQSFWPDDSVQPSDPVDLIGKWSIRYLLPHEWAVRQDGLALEESFSFGSYRSTADHTGDYILIDGFNGASRNPYHTFAVLELRLQGTPILKGYHNQLLTKADGMVEPHIAMNAALKLADVVGETTAVVAEVPNAAYSSWRRSLIQRTGKYALFVDDLTFREDASNMEVQIKWELDLPRGGVIRPIRTSELMRTSLEGQILTMEWSDAVQVGQQQRFFTLLGAPRGECYALSANAAALALPVPALALVGQYGHTEAEVAVLASDHAFGLKLSRLGLDQPLLVASHPVDIDWDYTTGELVVIATQDTLLQLALEDAQITVNGEQKALERNSDGASLLPLPAGRHRILSARPRTAMLAHTQTNLQNLLAKGESQRTAKREARDTEAELELPALQRIASANVGGQITDMISLATPAGPLLAVSSGKTIHLIAADGQTVRQMKTDGQIRMLRWWPDHQLLLAGCVDEKVIAFDTEGQRQWVFVSEMDPAVFRAAKQYWFKSAPGQNGIHGLYTGVFLDGKSQAFVGSACTLEIIDEHGQLIKRLPVFWGLSSVFTIVPGPNGSLNLLAGRKHNGTNDVAVINNRVLSADPRSLNSVPAGATYVGGWSAMNRHRLFYEDLAGDGTKLVISDINGTYNRVTAWELNGRALYDASFGPGPGYGGRGWRQDNYDTRNVRDMDIADLDGDGTQEVVVGLWSGHVVALDYQLQKVWALRLSSPPTTLRIVHTPGAPTSQIIVGSEDGTISLLNHQGQVLRLGAVRGVPTFIETLEDTAGNEVVMVGTHTGEVCGFLITE